MQKFSPAFARKQMRAMERREARAKQAAERVVAFLNRLFKGEIVYPPGRVDSRSKKKAFICKWGRWDIYWGEEFYYGDWRECFIFSHPLYGEWEASISDTSSISMIRTLLKEGGLNV